MLQINQTTIKTEASEIVDNVTYSMQYEVKDGKLTSILCGIFKAEEGSHPVKVGTVRLQDGKIFTELPEGSDVATYVEAFKGYVNEIREGLEKEGQ